MYQLLTCATGDIDSIDCCEHRYTYVQADCVRACMIQFLDRYTRTAMSELAIAVRFGKTKECVSNERKAQDMQLLVELAVQIFNERVARVESGLADWTMQEIWDAYSISCVLDYFHSKYKLDVTQALFKAGIYHPNRQLSSAEQATLPIVSNAACGAQTFPPSLYPPPTPPPGNPFGCGSIDILVQQTLSCDPSPADIAIVAGADVAAVNGTYLPGPSYNGLPAYYKDGVVDVVNGQFICFASFTGTTMLIVNAGATTYFMTGFGINPATKPWEVPYWTIQFGTGTYPAPTVTQGTSPLQTFSLEITLSNPQDDWEPGFIIPTVNGVQQASIPAVLGLNTIGPYNDGDEVSFVLTQAQYPAGQCNYTSPVYTSPFDPDWVLDGFGDANDIRVNFPDGEYYITSDALNELPGYPPAAIGDVVSTDVVVVGTPAPGDVIWMENPGNWFVVVSPGVIQPALPQPVFNLNTMAGGWYYSLPYMPPAILGDINVEIFVECNAGGAFSVYNGPVSGLVLPIYYAGSGWCIPANVSGYAIYTIGSCTYQVDMNVTEESPEGEILPLLGGLNNYVQNVEMDANFIPHKIWVGGAFTAYGATPAPYFTRLNADGSLDTNFNTNMGTGLNGAVLGLQVDYFTTGIFICGFFTQFDGNTANCLVHLNPDGTFDNTWGHGTGFAGPGSLFVQDLQLVFGVFLIAGGQFTSYKGTPAGNIVAIDIFTGDIDPSWDFGTGFNSYVQEIAEDNYGNIYVAGPFTTYKGVSCSSGIGRLVRILSDGTLDAGFNTTGAGFNDFIQDVMVMADDRVLVVGQFTTYDGLSAPYICMLDDTGALDAAFMANIGAGFGHKLQDVLVLPNQQILIWWASSTPAGTATNRMVLLNPDGTRDTSFEITNGMNNGAGEVEFDNSTGTIIAGGHFVSFDGVSQLRVTRIS